MKCKWKDCSNDARAKSLYCGGTCKKRDSRASGTNVPVEVGQEQVGQPSGTKSDKPEQLPNGLPDNCKLSTASLEHYLANPDKYVKRLEPDKMNWGDRMTSPELAAAGFKCNRVTIPGDWDYDGVSAKQEELPADLRVTV